MPSIRGLGVPFHAAPTRVAAVRAHIAKRPRGSRVEGNRLPRAPCGTRFGPRIGPSPRYGLFLQRVAHLTLMTPNTLGERVTQNAEKGGGLGHGGGRTRGGSFRWPFARARPFRLLRSPGSTADGRGARGRAD